MTRNEWNKAEKKIDPKFKGSLTEKLGCFSDKLCPVCNANLSAASEICLNGCHLGDEGQKRFSALMKDCIKASTKSDKKL